MELRLYKGTILGDYFYYPEKNYGIAVFKDGDVDVVSYDEDIGIMRRDMFSGVNEPFTPIRMHKNKFQRLEKAAHSKDMKTLDGILKSVGYVRNSVSQK